VKDELNVVILTSTDRSMAIGGDLALVKAALLYADRVTLVSPGVRYLAVALTMAELVTPGFTERHFAPGSSAPLASMLSKELDIGSPGHRTDEQVHRVALEVQRIVRMSNIVPALRLLGGSSDIAELLVAHDAGVLNIDDLGVLSQPSPNLFLEWLYDTVDGDYRPGVAAAMSERLLGVVGPSDNMLPMFSRGVVDRLGRDGIPVDASWDRALAEAHLAMSLIGRVASYPEARMDEILDVRRELSAPLVRFRSAVSTMARQMEGIPLGPAFKREATRLYRETAAPALLDLDELQKERGYAHQLKKHVKDGAGIPDVKDTIVLAATSYLMLPGLGVAAAGLIGTAAAAAVKLATSVAMERDQLSATSRANKFLFLAEAERRLRH
jgi:hypothetical protein